MSTARTPIAGVAADVPFLAVPPDGDGGANPVVIAWHLMDPPRTEAAFAAAMPLQGLHAWRIYLGLPMTGSRLPAGGFAELMQRGYEDAVLKLTGPITIQAAEEFDAAFRELRHQLDLADAPIAVLGGSTGAAVAQLVMTESDVCVRAAVLVSPVVQLQPTVEAMARQFDMSYQWSDAARAVAERLDFVARADEMTRAGQPAVMCIVGEDDDVQGFREPATRLCDALVSLSGDSTRSRLEVIPGMAHSLADEPGIEPAAQTPDAKRVDRLAVDWLRRHLSSS